MINNGKIIVALDTHSLSKAKKLVKTLWPRVQFFKIGLEMINTGQAPELMQFIKKLGGRVFYDAKLNDIPNTVVKAMKVISKLGVDMVSVHASAGAESLRAAVRNKGKSKIIGVTILTSIDDGECKSIFGINLKKKVLQFADMLVNEKCDGIVCSPQEAWFLRGFKKFDNLTIVTPGIRPLWASSNDQKRVTTLTEALRVGADYVVIGRPITNPPGKIGSPLKAIDLILKEIS